MKSGENMSKLPPPSTLNKRFELSLCETLHFMAIRSRLVSRGFTVRKKPNKAVTGG